MDSLDLFFELIAPILPTIGNILVFLLISSILYMFVIGTYSAVNIFVYYIESKNIKIRFNIFRFIRKNKIKYKYDNMDLPLIVFDDNDEYGDCLRGDIEDALYKKIEEEFGLFWLDNLTKKEIIEIYSNKDCKWKLLNCRYDITDSEQYLIDKIRYERFGEKRGSYANRNI